MSYNGWTNYATWRVNLEMIDGIDPNDMGWERLDKFDLADAIKENCIDILKEQTHGERSSFALDYAICFLDEVNWREIAESMILAYAEEDEEEDA